MADTEPQVFRNALTFHNSPAALDRFPFPFASDTARTTTNLSQNDRSGTGALKALFDVDEHYQDEIAEKAFVLSRDPLRCQVLPHMRAAEWDTLALVMENLATDFPADFTLTRNGDAWHWHNRRLGIDRAFTFGDAATLPCPPFDYIARQVQGDLLLLDQREGTLFLDGGMLTAAQGWSLHFALGMSWEEIHGPVPHDDHRAVAGRGLAFALNMQAGRPVRRPNWVICVTPRLDNTLETAAEWQPLYDTRPPGPIQDLLWLRVEVQQLYRLPRSHAILFGVRVYMASLRELSTRPAMARRLHAVLSTLDPAIAKAKGLPYLDEAVAWLSSALDR